MSTSTLTGYDRALAASLCLPENRIDVCRCGHGPEMHREALTATGSGCTHWLCDGCAEYEKASKE